MADPLHIVTPLIQSEAVTRRVGKAVLFKLDNLQPSGSFKIRGIGRTCQEAKANGAKTVVGSSGGNAGLAMAYAARKLGLKSILYVPTTTPQFMVEKIKEEGAEVLVYGENWNAANEKALERLKQEPNAALVHPFEQESTWEGHSSIVLEIKDQLKDVRPGAIVTAVGGGGLALGILLGLEKVGWKDVPLLAMETEGADCFNAALKANKVVRLESIKSVAKSLGVLSVCPKFFEVQSEFNVVSRVVTDDQAVASCLKFADDHRMLVEPACGAALAAVYFPTKELKRFTGPIVVIVCGGNIATVDTFAKYKSSQGST